MDPYQLQTLRSYYANVDKQRFRGRHSVSNYGHMAVALRLSRIESGVDGWQGSAWLAERLMPHRYSKPEVQLNLQTNVVQNNLTITISPEELKEIEAEAAPAREKVRKMFAAHRPGGLGNGDGQRKRTIDVQAEPVKPDDLAPITSKEDKPEFWFQFVSGSGERPVSKAVAIYVAVTIVNETVGRGFGNQAIVAFKNDPVTVSDVLSFNRAALWRTGWLADASAHSRLFLLCVAALSSLYGLRDLGRACRSGRTNVSRNELALKPRRGVRRRIGSIRRMGFGQERWVERRTPKFFKVSS